MRLFFYWLFPSHPLLDPLDYVTHDIFPSHSPSLLTTISLSWLTDSFTLILILLFPLLSTFNGVVIINCHNITPYYRTTQLKTNHSSRIENCLFYYLSTETACFGDREITLMAPSFLRLPTSSSSQSTTDWGSLVSHTITKNSTVLTLFLSPSRVDTFVEF